MFWRTECSTVLKPILEREHLEHVVARIPWWRVSGAGDAGETCFGFWKFPASVKNFQHASWVTHSSDKRKGNVTRLQG